jgi:hypothetical protein
MRSVLMQSPLEAEFRSQFLLRHNVGAGRLSVVQEC